MRRLVFVLALGLLLSAGSLTAWLARGRDAGPPGGPAALDGLGDHGRVPPFTLVERSGRPVGREDLRGRVWVANFIYTTCTDTCPLQSERLARLQDEFADAADLRLVSISVDPERDTPAALREYATRYGAGARWWFLTGDKRAVHCLALEGFRLSVADPAAPGLPDCGAALGRLAPGTAWASHGPGGLLMHSPRLVLVDRDARIRAYHRPDDPASVEALRSNLRRLLAGSAP